MTASANQKTALVTGGTSGVGKEIAMYLLQNGFTVFIPGRSVEKAKSSTSFQFFDHDGRVQFCEADLSEESGIQAIVEMVSANSGIGLLVHSAAYYSRGRVEHTGVSDLDQSYRVNLRAPYLLTQKLLPFLKAAKGTIVFLNSSVVQDTGKSALAAYSSSKAALNALAGCLRQEVNADGIRVLSVFLGKTATPMQKKACLEAGIEYRPGKMIQAEHAAKLICRAALSPVDMECTDLHLRPSVSYE